MTSRHEVLAAYLALSPADRLAFAREAGLATRAHSGAKRTKNPIKPATRALVLARERWRCYWCQADLTCTGADMDHVEHVRNGQPVYLMVVASCPACNQARRDDRSQNGRALEDIMRADMARARELRASPAGVQMFARVRAASGRSYPFQEPAASGEVFCEVPF